MKHRPDHAPRYALLLAWLLAVASFGWSTLAVAVPTNCSASSATLSLPSSVSVPPNTPTGPLPGATGTATIIFTCAGLPVTTSHSADYTAQIQAGQYLADLDNTNVPAGPGITFATSVSGLALLVTASPVQASSRMCLECGPTSTAGYVPGKVVAPAGTSQGAYSGTVTANFTAQLVKTIAGPIAPGTIQPISLIPFWWYISGGSQYSTSTALNAYLKLAATTVTVPACTISSPTDFSVTLPTVSATTLSADGQVAGLTPFNITITGCPSGVNHAVSTFGGSGIDSGTGNLKNSYSPRSDRAARTEVQLLNGSGGTAAALSPILLDHSTAVAQNSGRYDVVGGAVTLNYYAQYIANGRGAGAGKVSSTVQYTITYP